MIYLYGASGHGLVILDTLLTCKKQVAAFIDDADKGGIFGGLRCLHSHSFKPDQNDDLIISIGNNSIRERLSAQWKMRYACAIHPTAIISQAATIAPGTVVMAGAVINSHTVVGNHCIINTAATIDHECVLEDFVHVSPNATLCGNVTVGRGAWIGAGAVLIPGITIGAYATVGAGAVVIGDVAEGSVVAGNPARQLKTRR